MKNRICNFKKEQSGRWQKYYYFKNLAVRYVGFYIMQSKNQKHSSYCAYREVADIAENYFYRKVCGENVKNMAYYPVYN